MATINTYTSKATVDADELLSTFNVNSAGDTVSAETWVALWKLVFNRLQEYNTSFIDIYNTLTILNSEVADYGNRIEDLEELTQALIERMSNLELTWAALQTAYEQAAADAVEVREIKEALDAEFIHYGETPPTNEHIRLWVKPSDTAPRLIDTWGASTLTALEDTISIEPNRNHLFEDARVSDYASVALLAETVQGFLQNKFKMYDYEDTAYSSLTGVGGFSAGYKSELGKFTIGTYDTYLGDTPLPETGRHTGAAIGRGAQAFSGGALGAGAKTKTGAAVGDGSIAPFGAALGTGAATIVGVAAGYYAKAYGAGVALGKNAKTGNNTTFAVQIGEGTNSTNNTVQVLDKQVLNADGKVPLDRMILDTTVTADSANLITSGAVNTAITNAKEYLDSIIPCAARPTPINIAAITNENATALFDLFMGPKLGLTSGLLYNIKITDGSTEVTVPVTAVSGQAEYDIDCVVATFNTDGDTSISLYSVFIADGLSADISSTGNNCFFQLKKHNATTDEWDLVTTTTYTLTPISPAYTITKLNNTFLNFDDEITETGTNLVTSGTVFSAIADIQLSTTGLADSAVTSPKLAANAVTTAKLNNLAVTTAKLANLSVTKDKLAANSVTSEKISGALKKTQVGQRSNGTTNTLTAGSSYVNVSIDSDGHANHVIQAVIATDNTTATTQHLVIDPTYTSGAGNNTMYPVDIALDLSANKQYEVIVDYASKVFWSASASSSERIVRYNIYVNALETPVTASQIQKDLVYSKHMEFVTGDDPVSWAFSMRPIDSATVHFAVGSVFRYSYTK